jgi:hypothetical protein
VGRTGTIDYTNPKTGEILTIPFIQTDTGSAFPKGTDLHLDIPVSKESGIKPEHFSNPQFDVVPRTDFIAAQNSKAQEYIAQNGVMSGRPPADIPSGNIFQNYVGAGRAEGAPNPEGSQLTQAARDSGDPRANENRVTGQVEGEPVRDSRDFLVDTARAGSTISQQGIREAIDRLHPDFAIMLAQAIQDARDRGMNVGVFSAYRAPDMGANPNYARVSAHGAGVAVDVYGIGRPGSREAQEFYQIARDNGLYNPYGPNNAKEWNHYQLVPETGRALSAEIGPNPRSALSGDALVERWNAGGTPVAAPPETTPLPTERPANAPGAPEWGNLFLGNVPGGEFPAQGAPSVDEEGMAQGAQDTAQMGAPSFDTSGMDLLHGASSADEAGMALPEGAQSFDESGMRLPEVDLERAIVEAGQNIPPETWQQALETLLREQTPGWAPSEQMAGRGPAEPFTEVGVPYMNAAELQQGGDRPRRGSAARARRRSLHHATAR